MSHANVYTIPVAFTNFCYRDFRSSGTDGHLGLQYITSYSNHSSTDVHQTRGHPLDNSGTNHGTTCATNRGALDEIRNGEGAAVYPLGGKAEGKTVLQSVKPLVSCLKRRTGSRLASLTDHGKIYNGVSPLGGSSSTVISAASNVGDESSRKRTLLSIFDEDDVIGRSSVGKTNQNETRRSVFNIHENRMMYISDSERLKKRSKVLTWGPVEVKEFVTVDPLVDDESVAMGNRRNGGLEDDVFFEDENDLGEGDLYPTVGMNKLSSGWGSIASTRKDELLMLRGKKYRFLSESEVKAKPVVINEGFATATPPTSSPVQPCVAPSSSATTSFSPPPPPFPSLLFHTPAPDQPVPVAATAAGNITSNQTNGMYSSAAFRIPPMPLTLDYAFPPMPPTQHSSEKSIHSNSSLHLRSSTTFAGVGSSATASLEHNTSSQVQSYSINNQIIKERGLTVENVNSSVGRAAAFLIPGQNSKNIVSRSAHKENSYDFRATSQVSYQGHETVGDGPDDFPSVGLEASLEYASNKGGFQVQQSKSNLLLLKAQEERVKLQQQSQQIVNTQSQSWSQQGQRKQKFSGGRRYS